MPTFTHLIFDLDGTIINSKLGLLNSTNYMLQQMGINHLDSTDFVDQLIGPPIQDGLKNVLGFREKQVELGVRLFREYYSTRGLYEGELFPGILDLLEELQTQGKQIYLATSKRDQFVSTVIRHFELDRYLDDVQGAGNGGKHTKAELITKLMDRNQINPSEKVVMIGDTIYDIIGGQANEISTIGVGYGFGKSEEIQRLNPTYFAKEVEELFELLV
ncbi:HAD hydrolase-like protein [Sunxiuqinia sp. A32]|uniref:HAD hydrolase-like protein n=1 Tax=Sunxiuqinia sp. A32 TaxID=3461496 RepID=UPI0040455AC1